MTSCCSPPSIVGAGLGPRRRRRSRSLDGRGVATARRSSPAPSSSPGSPSRWSPASRPTRSAISVGRQYDAFVHPRRPDEGGEATASRLLSGAGNRYDYWRISVERLAGRPGPGRRRRQLRPSRTSSQRTTTEDIRQPHSLVLQALSELGLPGLALVLAFLIAVVGWAVLRRQARSADLRAPNAACSSRRSACSPPGRSTRRSTGSTCCPASPPAALIAAAVLLLPTSGSEATPRPSRRRLLTPGRRALAAAVIILPVAVAGVSLSRQVLSQHYAARHRSALTAGDATGRDRHSRPCAATRQRGRSPSTTQRPRRTPGSVTRTPPSSRCSRGRADRAGRLPAVRVARRSVRPSTGTSNGPRTTIESPPHAIRANPRWSNSSRIRARPPPMTDAPSKAHRPHCRRSCASASPTPADAQVVRRPGSPRARSTRSRSRTPRARGLPRRKRDPVVQGDRSAPLFGEGVGADAAAAPPAGAGDGQDEPARVAPPQGRIAGRLASRRQRRVARSLRHRGGDGAAGRLRRAR